MKIRDINGKIRTVIHYKKYSSKEEMVACKLKPSGIMWLQLGKECEWYNESQIPLDAHSLEVFAIKNNEAFIGFKLQNKNFHYIQVPFTEFFNWTIENPTNN
jgi:hypothetical protein